jgi:predicted CopG family antitoxin
LKIRWDEQGRIYTRKCTYLIMAHKTLTISEEAYNALARTKGRDESFTKVILRLTRKKAAGNLLDYVRSFSPDEELASAVEKVLEKRSKTRLRTPEF